MKTKEQIQAALDEIKAVCDKHGVVLIGVDPGESSWSDIFIGDSEFPEMLDTIEWLKFNEVDSSGFGHFVNAIGTPEAKE